MYDLIYSVKDNIKKEDRLSAGFELMSIHGHVFTIDIDDITDKFIKKMNKSATIRTKLVSKAWMEIQTRRILQVSSCFSITIIYITKGKHCII